MGSWQTIKIYNILGKEIATLINEEKTAGKCEMAFNLGTSFKNPASRAHLYQLRAGNFVDTRKMILMK